MKQKYEDHRFQSKTLILINLANGIVNEYAEQGFDLTLRQLYYQLVSRDTIENSQKSYKRLGNTISKARRAGLIDWHAIVDRTRNVKKKGHWDSPKEIVEAAVNGYYRDRWEGQPFRPEVWIEKDALIGVIARVCNKLDVPHFACRGYVSDSEMWAAGRRMRSQYLYGGQLPIVVHLGDHDPSGIDMTRDIKDRLELFAEVPVQVERIALNMDQIDEYQPPPNPAKLTDSRIVGYMEKYGNESWELDALKPDVLHRLISEQLDKYRDMDIWDDVVKLENEHKAALREAAESLDL